MYARNDGQRFRGVRVRETVGGVKVPIAFAGRARV